MKTAEMRDIKLFDPSMVEILWKRTTLSLVDRNTTHLPLFGLCPQAGTVIRWLDQQVNSVDYSLDIRSMQDTTRNTPPR